MNKNDIAYTPGRSDMLIIEQWALLNEGLQFVPQLTEEARDFYFRRNYKPSGNILVHADVKALGKKKK